jgi:hypothetical protein
MNILIIIISLFLGVFIRPVFASEINIDSVSTITGISAGTTFSVVFQVVDAQPNTFYHFKFCGGPEGDNNAIKTYNSENGKYVNCIDGDSAYSSSWDDLPSFNTDSSGYASVEGFGYIPPDKIYLSDYFDGIYFLFVRIADPNDPINQNIGFSGYVQEITVLPPLTTPIPPTATPIPPTPTKVPTPTLTLTPTPTSHNPSPAVLPTPIIDMSIFGVTTDSTVPVITILDDLLNSIEASNSTFIETGSNPVAAEEVTTTKKSNLIPIIFISLSTLFLIISLLLVKIKFKPKCLKK